MSCDGDIASEEVDMIKKMSKEKNLFGDIDIDKELDGLVNEINLKGNPAVVLVAGLNGLRGGRALQDREAGVDGVAVEDAGKAPGYHQGDAAGLYCDRGVLTG